MHSRRAADSYACMRLAIGYTVVIFINPSTIIGINNKGNWLGEEKPNSFWLGLFVTTSIIQFLKVRRCLYLLNTHPPQRSNL